MTHLKGFRSMHAAQSRSEWVHGFKLRELRGQQVGIIGLGDLGGSTARVLKPFGVHLRALRRSGKPSPDVDEVFSNARVDEFVDGLDVLVWLRRSRATGIDWRHGLVDWRMERYWSTSAARQSSTRTRCSRRSARSVLGAALDVFLSKSAAGESALASGQRLHLPHPPMRRLNHRARAELFLAVPRQPARPLHHVVDGTIG